ncbi:MAG: histidinol-phosphate transaminase [Gammaproteobacteria bacterium]|nr:histidinol-phosphate transaminase [Gammaproteobacteria bacterium]
MKNNITDLARKEIVSMKAYRSARSEGLKGSVFLDANENAYSDTRYNRYPESQPDKLADLLTNVYGVDRQQIIVTRGSDEGIDLLIRLFCREGLDKIMVCPPTYGMYKVAATIQGAEIIEVPLIKDREFSLDVDALLCAWEPAIKIIFLCSPNNPTGNVLSKSDILSLCQSLSDKSVIVVDEAYIEFANEESVANCINDYPNLVILRTLSKAYGLAGIRCGVTIANSEIIKLLLKIIAPYPIPSPISDIVCQQVNSNITQNIISTIQKEKELMKEFLTKIPSVKKVWESQANYLLIQTVDANKMMNACLKYGIVIRNRSSDYGLNNCVRITIGSPNENALLREAISNVKKNIISG